MIRKGNALALAAAGLTLSVAVYAMQGRTDADRAPQASAAPSATAAPAPRPPATPQEAVFVEKCAMCHRENGMGTNLLARRMDKGVAMLEKRDDLTAELITVAVRQSIGNMPRIPRGEVSDAQLRSIEQHLVPAPTGAAAAPVK